MNDKTDNKAEEKKVPDKQSDLNKASNKKKLEKSVDNEKSADPKKIESSAGKIGSFIVPIILLLILGVSFFYINKRLTALENNIDADTADVDGLIQDIDDRIARVNSGFAGMQQKLEDLQSKQDVLSHSLSQPVQQQMHINKDYALAEIEHLLIIASHNLQLEHDVATALSAMEAADKRLLGLNDPQIIQVREQLIADMNSLKSINQADLSGLGLYLSDLINRVDTLPLKENVVVESLETRAAEQQEKSSGVKEFFTLVWQELKSLVVITRDKNVGKVRLLPDEVYFLRSNIKLELANARFAVFNRDTNNLHASVEHIQTWLNDYFDIADASVGNINETLTRMKKLDLTFPVVDITSSLESVRALIREQDNRPPVLEDELN